MSTGRKVSVPTPIAATEMHRRDRLRVRAALVGRGAGGDMADPGDPGGDDRHMRRGDHRIAPARDVTADAADRDVAVSEHHSRQGLDLDILQRGALDLGEVADLRLGEADVVERLRRDPGDEVADLRLRQAEARRRPLVEALAELAHRRVAARAHIGDDRFDRGAGFGVGLVLGAGERGGLDVARHGGSSSRLLFRLLLAGFYQAGRSQHGQGYDRNLAILQTLAPRHSMTSSARARIDCGTVRPSALAVFRLMTSSNLVGWTTGRSAGFSPLRIRPV